MRERKIPYTSDELRSIADSIDRVVDAVGTDLDDGDWRWGLSVAIFDDDFEVVGYVKPHEGGWLGFYPIEANG